MSGIIYHTCSVCGSEMYPQLGPKSNGDTITEFIIEPCKKCKQSQRSNEVEPVKNRTDDPSNFKAGDIIRVKSDVGSMFGRIGVVIKPDGFDYLIDFGNCKDSFFSGCIERYSPLSNKSSLF